MEEIVINNQLDKECYLYNNDTLIGVIKNSTALNDVLVQIYQRRKANIDVSGYYFMFNGEKLVPHKDGRIKHPPYDFFSTDKRNFEILYHLIDE